MKKYFALFLVVVVIFTACKKNNLLPNTNSTTKSANETLVLGIWKWSAQYTSAEKLYVLNPANTGIQETLQFNADGTWSQTKNTVVTNTGTYSFINALVPGGLNGGGTIPFFSVVNSRVTDTARFDDFNFNTGFVGSYMLTKDSLIFYGVNSIDTSGTSYLADRIYIR